MVGANWLMLAITRFTTELLKGIKNSWPPPECTGQEDTFRSFITSLFIVFIGAAVNREYAKHFEQRSFHRTKFHSRLLIFM